MSVVERASGVPEWQNTIRASLMERQAESEVYRDIVEQYQRLARTARELKIRNKALLQGGAGPSNAGDGPSPLLSHLENQLTTLRNELSTVYRTQAASQNKQLSLSDALRDRDEEVRGLREEVRELREARDGGHRREKDLEERLKGRTKDMEILNDELLSTNLELNHLTQQNNALKTDNASLLQRWIDKMNLTAEEMNDDFEKEAKNDEAGAVSETAQSPSQEDWEILEKARTGLEESSVLVEGRGDDGEEQEHEDGDGWDEARREA